MIRAVSFAAAVFVLAVLAALPISALEMRPCAATEDATSGALSCVDCFEQYKDTAFRYDTVRGECMPITECSPHSTWSPVYLRARAVDNANWFDAIDLNKYYTTYRADERLWTAIILKERLGIRSFAQSALSHHEEARVAFLADTFCLLPANESAPAVKLVAPTRARLYINSTAHVHALGCAMPSGQLYDVTTLERIQNDVVSSDTSAYLCNVASSAPPPTTGSRAPAIVLAPCSTDKEIAIEATARTALSHTDTPSGTLVHTCPTVDAVAGVTEKALYETIVTESASNRRLDSFLADTSSKQQFSYATVPAENCRRRLQLISRHYYEQEGGTGDKPLRPETFLLPIEDHLSRNSTQKMLQWRGVCTFKLDAICESSAAAPTQQPQFMCSNRRLVSAEQSPTFDVEFTRGNVEITLPAQKWLSWVPVTTPNSRISTRMVDNASVRCRGYEFDVSETVELRNSTKCGHYEHVISNARFATALGRVSAPYASITHSRLVSNPDATGFVHSDQVLEWEVVINQRGSVMPDQAGWTTTHLIDTIYIRSRDKRWPAVTARTYAELKRSEYRRVGDDGDEAAGKSECLSRAVPVHTFDIFTSCEIAGLTLTGQEVLGDADTSSIAMVPPAPPVFTKVPSSATTLVPGEEIISLPINYTPSLGNRSDIATDLAVALQSLIDAAQLFEAQSELFNHTTSRVPVKVAKLEILHTALWCVRTEGMVLVSVDLQAVDHCGQVGMLSGWQARLLLNNGSGDPLYASISSRRSAAENTALQYQSLFYCTILPDSSRTTAIVPLRSVVDSLLKFVKHPETVHAIRISGAGASPFLAFAGAQAALNTSSTTAVVVGDKVTHLMHAVVVDHCGHTATHVVRVVVGNVDYADENEKAAGATKGSWCSRTRSVDGRTWAMVPLVAAQVSDAIGTQQTTALWHVDIKSEDVQIPSTAATTMVPKPAGVSTTVVTHVTSDAPLSLHLPGLVMMLTALALLLL